MTQICRTQDSCVPKKNHVHLSGTQCHCGRREKDFPRGELHALPRRFHPVLLMSDDAGAYVEGTGAAGSAGPLWTNCSFTIRSMAGRQAKPSILCRAIRSSCDERRWASWRAGCHGRRRPAGIDPAVSAFDSPQHGELIVDGGKAPEGGRYLRYETRRQAAEAGRCAVPPGRAPRSAGAEAFGRESGLADTAVEGRERLMRWRNERASGGKRRVPADRNRVCRLSADRSERADSRN